MNPLSTSVSTPDTDVLVIGGGPAGATVATLLAQKGRQVMLLEKDYHPRFHIGESLLPMNLPILARLGVLEQVRSIGVVKPGAEFGEDAWRRQTVYFAKAMDKNHPYAFQVRRSQFDELLLRNAASQGVAVREGARVTAVARLDDGRFRISARGPEGEELTPTARFVVDASGRDTFLAGQLGLKRKNPRHQSAAVFGHFRNVQALPGADAGNIGIYWFDHGWFWMIPLQDGVTSVGAVCWPDYLKTRRADLDAFLEDTIALCAPVAARMQEAQACEPVRATGNYSYSAARMSGQGWLLVGDAYAFVDPVFSTGVYFAMHGACLAADAADAYLRDPAGAGPALQRFEDQVRHGIGTVSWFIYRFTSPAMRRLFMNPRNVLHMEEAMLSLLAGDLFRDTPIRLPLALFKGLYRLRCLLDLPHNWRARRHRARNVRVTFTGGTTSQDPL